MRICSVFFFPFFRALLYSTTCTYIWAASTHLQFQLYRNNINWIKKFRANSVKYSSLLYRTMEERYQSHDSGSGNGNGHGHGFNVNKIHDIWFDQRFFFRKTFLPNPLCMKYEAWCLCMCVHLFICSCLYTWALSSHWRVVRFSQNRQSQTNIILIHL